MQRNRATPQAKKPNEINGLVVTLCMACPVQTFCRNSFMETDLALEHITVLDLTHMLSGPYGTMLLADLGARTIKVEPPVTGEGTRRLLEHDPDYARDGMGAYYLTLNRNKQSVCVDLKSEAGKAVFLDLVRHADVVFDNFSVGVTERLGIDYATLSKVNPRIVTCSVTGFGQSGPETQRPAFDQVVQAMGGSMSTSRCSTRRSRCSTTWRPCT